jgi:hypothetical protein
LNKDAYLDAVKLSIAETLRRESLNAEVQTPILKIALGFNLFLWHTLSWFRNNG